MKKSFIALFVGLLSVLSVHAQMVSPVSWKFSQKKISSDEIELTFSATVEQGWHMYSQFTPDGGPMATSINFEESENFKLVGKAVESPKPHEEMDKVFGVNVKYFENNVEFKQKVKIVKGGTFKIVGGVDYQACREGQCSMFDQEFDFEVKGEASAPVEEGTKDDSLWTFFWLAFVGGLAAVIMPCVFPMIPMTVSFFMHSDTNKTKAKIKALFFAFSIILIYTAFGLLISMVFGAGFTNWLSTNWVPNLFFFIIFMMFAASFFGAFEIVLPSWIVNKSDSQADKGGYIGAFFMAFTLVLVSFSCTAPIVGTILVEAARGSLLRPTIGMLGFSLAVALPFGFFAFFPSKLGNLPKSGGWLNSVKVVLGFIEVALGFKFLMVVDQTYHLGLLDREIYIAIWIVVFALMGFYLLGKIRFAHDSEMKHLGVGRLGLVILTFSFVVYLVPGMWGAPLKALAGYMPPQETIDFDVNRIVRDHAKEIMKSGVSTGANSVVANENCEEPKYSDFLHLPHGLDGYFDYDQAVKCAKALDKPLFIDFTGHGCVNCREMEQTVWGDPRVLKMLKEDYVVVALYVDDKTKLPENEWYVSTYDGKKKKTLAKKNGDFQMQYFDSNAQPNYILLDNSGDRSKIREEVLAPSRGHNLDVDEFVAFLQKGIENYKKRHNK